jgi:hypothetical protein
MQWNVDDPIAAPIEDVEAIMFDRAVLEAIPTAMKGIASVKVLVLESSPTRAERVLYFRPALNVPRFALRVPRENTEWTESLVWDPSRRAGQLTITPNMPDRFRKYFNCGGTLTLEAVDATHTIRRLAAELTIDYGIMTGALAKRLAIGIIQRQFLREGRLVEQRAQARAHARGVSSG